MPENHLFRAAGAAKFASASSGRRSNLNAALLRPRLMKRWVSILGSLFLAVALLTGGAAHAAERFECIPVSRDAAGHFDGDGDEFPAGEEGVAHHHAGCSGHQLAMPAADSELISGVFTALVPLAWREAGVPARGPDSLLRPPIA